jgi:hypothetical protein
MCDSQTHRHGAALSEYTAKPSDLGMDYEDLYITTADGVKVGLGGVPAVSSHCAHTLGFPPNPNTQLNCWLINQREDYQHKPTLIYFSGNAGSTRTPHLHSTSRVPVQWSRGGERVEN